LQHPPIKAPSTNRLPDNPIAVTAQIKNAVRLVAIDDRARSAGLSIGQTLSDARALEPKLECFEQDIPAQNALMETIADWCDRYTPLVAIEHSQNDPIKDGLFLDITGCAHLFDGETALADDLIRRLHLQGFAAHAAIADTPGAAWAFSRFGHERIIPPGKHGELLDPLPLGALRLEVETIEALSKVGLKTIGCITTLPRAPLAARFGSDLIRRLNRAQGHEDEVISPGKHIAELSSERNFPEPITLIEDIEQVIENLAGNLAPRLEERGIGIRWVELKLFRVDGEVLSLTVQASSPLRNPARIRDLFANRIAGLHDDLDAGFGFDLIRLNVVEDEVFNSHQGDLVNRKAPDDNLHALVDKLGARLGTDRVTAFELTDTHIPERSFALTPVMRSGNTLVSSCAEESSLFDLMPRETIESAPLTRPLFLFERPERIDVIAEVPEGPPIRFRWRKALYRVEKCEGPERIACEWWADGRGSSSRDYFKIEEASGHRFWMFRRSEERRVGKECRSRWSPYH